MTDAIWKCRTEGWILLCKLVCFEYASKILNSLLLFLSLLNGSALKRGEYLTPRAKQVSLLWCVRKGIMKHNILNKSLIPQQTFPWPFRKEVDTITENDIGKGEENANSRGSLKIHPNLFSFWPREKTSAKKNPFDQVRKLQKWDF